MSTRPATHRIPERTEPKLLDVGCGDGSYAEAENWRRHYDYHGIDTDPEKVTATRDRGLSARVADAHDMPFSDGEFAHAVAKAVLEHVEDPLAVVEECHRVLQPGGRLQVIVPSDRSFDVWGDYTHRRAFREDAIHDLLHDGGFTVDYIGPRMEWASVGMAIRSLGRMLAPWTPYGYPRAWEARARKVVDQ